MMTAEQNAGLAALLAAATPGPWAVKHLEVWPYEIRIDAIQLTWQRIAYSTRQNNLADVRGGVGFKGDERKDVRNLVAEQEANAALIARAPDLAADVLRLTATVADIKLQLGMANHAEDATRAELAEAAKHPNRHSYKVGIAVGKAEHAATVADLTAQLAKSDEMRVHWLDTAEKFIALNQDLTAANTALVTECARLKAREVEARNVLQAISDAQVPDQPATSPLSEADYVRRHFAYLRSAARAYLAGGAE